MNLELFPCSGGMAEGFRRAGVTFDLAIDYSADACDSYEKNHGHRPLQMDVNDFARMVRAGWRPMSKCQDCKGRGWHVGDCHPRETCGGCDGWGRILEQIDLLVADPPCTPWSRAGKRQGIDDERDCLRVTAELIRLLRPRAYLIGNVPGLQDSTSWGVVQKVIGGLAELGYCVRDYVSLDAADYGVPQHRVRPFWFGHLAGPCVRWPEPTHAAPEQVATLALPGTRRLLPWVTCRAALGHLPLADLGRPVRMRIRDRGEDGRKNGGDASRCSSPDLPAKTVVSKDARKGGQILIPGVPQEVIEHPRHPASRVDEPSFVIKTSGGRAAGNGSILRLQDPNRPPAQPDEPHRAVTGVADQFMLEWPWDRPATTILGDERSSVPGHHDASVGNSSHKGPNAVVLSEKATAILQGFPETWVFSGQTKVARWAQIGMAMPPGLAEPVARAIAEQLRGVRRESKTG